MCPGFWNCTSYNTDSYVTVPPFVQQKMAHFPVLQCSVLQFSYYLLLQVASIHFGITAAAPVPLDDVKDLLSE